MNQSVSVIIPNYNCAPFIAKAVESCIAQGASLKEIIVVDDCSTDESWAVLQELLAKYTELRVVKNISKGGNNARNYGLSLSTGKYIQWLDADDFILEGKFAAQVNYLDENPLVDIVYSDWQLDEYNEKGELSIQEFKKRTAVGNYLKELLEDNWSCPHNYLLRRETAELLAEIEGWNPSTRIAQDREYFTKAALYGKRFEHLPGNFSVYNRRRKSFSVSRAMDNRQRAQNIIDLLQKFIDILQHQNWITADEKRQYEKILVTQIIYYSSVYDISINGRSRKVSLADIDWKLINGIRSKFKVLRTVFNSKR